MDTRRSAIELPPKMEDQEDKMPKGSGLLEVARTGIFRLRLSGFPLGSLASSLKYVTRSDRKRELMLCLEVSHGWHAACSNNARTTEIVS